MPRMKITQLGMEGFTGALGMFNFTDGVSDDVLSGADCQRIAGIIRAETLEGDNPSAAQMVIDAHSPAAVAKPRGRRKAVVAPTPAAPTPAAPTPADEGAEGIDAPEVPEPRFTREQLEALADQGGIEALHPIMSELGIVEHTIEEAVAAILAFPSE